MITFKKFLLCLMLFSLFSPEIFCIGESRVVPTFTSSYFQTMKNNLSSYREYFQNFRLELYKRMQKSKEYLSQKYRTFKERTGKLIKEFQEQSKVIEETTAPVLPNTEKKTISTVPYTHIKEPITTQASVDEETSKPSKELVPIEEAIKLKKLPHTQPESIIESKTSATEKQKDTSKISEEIPEELSIEEAPSLEINEILENKPELKIKTPEEIEYEEAFLNFPIDYENKKYIQQKEEELNLQEKKQRLQNSYIPLLDELKNVSTHIENIDAFKEKIKTFNELSKKINTLNNNLLLSKKPTEEIKKQVAFFINQTIETFNDIITNLEDLQKNVTKKDIEKSKNGDTLFLILVTKALEPFINFFTIKFEINGRLMIHSPSEILISTETVEKLIVLKNKIRKYGSMLEPTQVWGYIILNPKRNSLTTQNLSDIESVIYNIASLIVQQKNRLEK